MDSRLGRMTELAVDATLGQEDRLWVVKDRVGALLRFADLVGSLVEDGTLAGLSQPLDADLTAIAALASAANKLPYATGAQAWALTDLSAFARTLLDDADAAAMRTTLGVQAAGSYQAQDATLTALAGLTTLADRLPYFTGVDTASVATLTSFARTLLDDTTAGGALTTLGVSAFIQTLLDDTTAAAARTTLGAGTSNVTNLDSLSDVAVSSPGTWQSLAYDGSTWANKTHVIEKMANFTVGMQSSSPPVSADMEQVWVSSAPAVVRTKRWQAVPRAGRIIGARLLSNAQITVGVVQLQVLIGGVANTLFSNNVELRPTRSTGTGFVKDTDTAAYLTDYANGFALAAGDDLGLRVNSPGGFTADNGAIPTACYFDAEVLIAYDPY